MCFQGRKNLLKSTFSHIFFYRTYYFGKRHEMKQCTTFKNHFLNNNCNLRHSNIHYIKKYSLAPKPYYVAHWSRFPIFYQQVFFSRLLADFDAQYGKLGVLGVRQSIFEKKNIWPQRSKTFKVTFKVWKSQIYACPASLCTFSASKIKCPSNQNVLTYQRSPFDLWNLQYDL